jgi:hypothetical protein
LEKDLHERPDITKGERTALRIQAHAVDLAEAMGDPSGITTASLGYLTVRQAAGLSAGGVKPVDAFDNLLADLARAGTGSSDLSQS